MASDDRNFRSSYYEKVGFRSVEEKKSLEILLKDKPIDVGKIRQFCLRFTVPGLYRNLVWKLLLCVVPIHVDSHPFVMKQREQQYKDLLHGLKTMRIVNNQTSKPQLYILMWLLETGKLKFDFVGQLDSELHNNLAAISHTLSSIFESDVDAYWISKGFFECVVKFFNDIPHLIALTKTQLEKEDQDLNEHLVEIGAISAIPFHNWLCCCFAGIISESSLEKVWDKLIGGSCKVLIFVAVVLLITLRRLLLKCTTVDSVLDCLGNISEEVSEVIVNQGIEMWQQSGTSFSTGLTQRH
ncbi:hypothetical protein R5R35_000314 [Gryllus longicercus]|uniref:TBC1 domain family member 7 n=1 Tax=Gryllus longicercus TaxID=2509291 RepID=A0AAN9ZH95_9ORTH